jgi:alpha-L-rhamnosidase
VQGSQGSSAVSRDTPGALISTACYAYSARLLSQIAAVLGKDHAAATYAALAQRIGERYNAEFWDESAGGYGSCNQSCNAISLYMQLVPAERVQRTLASLVAAVQQADMHLTTGNICTKYLFEVLTAHGQAELAVRVALQESYPSWGFMLANGATTLWERWELATGGGMNSHNHPMLGSVGAWFYRAIAGIQADEQGPGFARFTICPQVAGGLTSAAATLNTAHGPIRCAWQVTADGLALELTVPVGSRARVSLPAPQGAQLTEDGQRLAVAWEDGRLVCELGSGEYRLRVTPGPL